jgi:hypothetical protein
MEGLLDTIARRLGLDSWDRTVQYVNSTGHKDDDLYNAAEILKDLRVVINELDKHSQDTMDW